MAEVNKIDFRKKGAIVTKQELASCTARALFEFERRGGEGRTATEAWKKSDVVQTYSTDLRNDRSFV